MFRRHLLVLLAACAVVFGAAAGCSFDIEPGSQLAGQQCSSDEDCADGLVCSDRICRPTAGDSPWGSGADAGEPDAGEPECCEGGCADGQICNDCTCVDYDPNTCDYQDQPCNMTGQEVNGFLCMDYDGMGQSRCMGFCDPGAPEPDSTCPDPSSHCSFAEPTDPEGLCLSSCTIDGPCADDEMRCIYYDTGFGDGICHPVTQENPIGSDCNPQEPLSCADQALCMEGTCMQSCRPFHGDGTDCADGYCVPMDAQFGVCREDVSDGQGGCTMEGGTCGEDATVCDADDLSQDELQCAESCRLAEGAQDCSRDDHYCHRVDQQDEILGICGPGFSTQ